MGRELKRVALDFDCPIGETWQGYINPHYTAKECTACDGSGYSPRAKHLHDLWYGYVPFDPRSTGSNPFKSTDQPILDAALRNLNNAPTFYDTSQEALIREAQRLADHFNAGWIHHLSQADVDALIAAERLMDFTHTWRRGIGWRNRAAKGASQKHADDLCLRVKRLERRVRSGDRSAAFHLRRTATKFRHVTKIAIAASVVNEWSLCGMGHDSINCHVCIAARCKREGADTACAVCQGHGDIWPSEEAKQRYEAWEKVEPPTGDGYQIWQTVSEGGPCSPVFETPEELARWMAENDDTVTKDTTYDQWVAWIRGPGWSPSFVMKDDVFMDGVVAALQ